MIKTIYQLLSKLFVGKIEFEEDIIKKLKIELRKDKDFIIVISGEFFSRVEAKKISVKIQEIGYNPIILWVANNVDGGEALVLTPELTLKDGQLKKEKTL